MSTTLSPITSINPATGEVLARFDPFTQDEVDHALDEAQDAFVAWRERSFEERAVPMRRLAALLRERADRYGRLITLEMGKPIVEAKAELEKCAWGCEHYADHAARYLADEVVTTNAAKSFVAFQPLGIVLAVMPWNFPFWQVMRFAAPAFMAGNAAVLKHASNVPQCALAIEEVFRDAGFPEGLLRTLLLAGAQVEPVIDDERVRAVTLTGSSDTGSRIAQLAGRALKKSVLELGGNDPFIVMPSADLDEAASIAVKARTINNGQSCIAAKRFIIIATIYGEFERRFVEGMKALKVGNPLDETTNVGPLATPLIREELDEQVKRAVATGARVLTGGKRLPGPGNYYEPTVLVGVKRDSPVYREEIFGPVAMLFRAQDIAEAIEIANDSPFGLGASAWTRDASERALFIDEIEAGQVFINGMVASDPRLPFGGVKHSGYGRELGPFGIREFTNIKTVWIREASAQAGRSTA